MDDGDIARLRGMEVDVQFGQIVASNLPAVLVGALELWPAISRWDPANGGLEYLKNLTGTTQIQAITSKSGSVFYGHIKGHERVPLMFGSFIDHILFKAKIENAAASSGSKMLSLSVDTHLPRETFDSSGYVKNDTVSGDCSIDSETSHNLELYLAQVPIYSREQEGGKMLSPLMQDISTPSVLEGEEVSNINLWMSMKSSRSSTHYDPYHNILCVVAGEKRVTLWPPSESPYLYPLPIHGEASNHSGVDIDAPNYDMHPLFRKALRNAKVVTVQSGDALFIPEGWYHQVDNVGVTIAVNFWWPSKISLSLGSRMDGYILRRVVSSLLDREKKRILKDGIESFTNGRDALLTEGTRSISREKVNLSDSQGEQHSKVEDIKDLTAEEAIHLKTLVTSALGETSISPAAESKMVKNNGRSNQIEDDNVQVQSTYQRPVLFQEDLVCGVFATLGALSLQRVLLVMATQFPLSLRILVMDVLSPAAAELLTMKFEELEGSLETSLQVEFYEKFYSVFESSEVVMAILLEKKKLLQLRPCETLCRSFSGFLAVLLLHDYSRRRVLGVTDYVFYFRERYNFSVHPQASFTLSSGDSATRVIISLSMYTRIRGLM